MNRMGLKKSVFIVLVIFMAAVLPALALAKVSIEQQRELFSKADKALKMNDMQTYFTLREQLKDYPLYGYLLYGHMVKRVSNTPERDIRKFIKDYADSPLSWRMQSVWLNYLGRTKQWEKFLAEYKPTSNTKLKCYRAWALYQSKQNKQADELIKSLWLVANSQPNGCDNAFERWISRGKLTTELRWQRIELAMEKGNVSLAKFIAKTMSKRNSRWVNRWIDMRRRPATNLHLKMYQGNSPLANRIVRYGVKRLARNDVAAAHDFWESVRAKHQLDSAIETEKVDHYVALRAAYQKHPMALEWLAAVENADEQIKVWRIRVALAQQDWWSALTWIDALSEQEKNSEQWRYWRARILELQSASLPVLSTAAERIFASLSENRSYHGFLSAGRIGSEIQLNPESLEFSKQELQPVENQPAITRARELFFLKLKLNARREWYHAIKNFNELQLKKASVLASQWGWHDRAIMTVAKASHFDDLDLRFPVAYKDIILAQADGNEIDPAWVYGVMRQESSFMSDARSHAGALGLMQLMPRTGRFTAREEKIRIRSNRDLLNVQKNIRLGTAYLRRMLDANAGNSILATSSYNAGPHRTKQWMPKQDMPADIWVETIPYNETRSYVQRVMSYTVIYDHKLGGKTAHIRSRMPEIKARVMEDS